MVIGTRWDRDDLIGKILNAPNADEWVNLRLPMEADSEDDPLNRKIGERLWTNYYNQKEIDIHKLDPKNWHCMWECRPLVEEQDWLSIDALPITDERPKGLTKFCCGVDIALTQGGGDWTVLAVGALTPARELVLVDMVRKRITPDQIIEEMLKLHEAFKISESLLDDDNSSKTLMSLANEMLRRKGAFLPLRTLPMRGQSKEIRAAPFKGLALQGGVKLLRGSWNEFFLREVSQFPRQATGVHDDTIDAVGLLARRIAAMSCGQVEEVKKPEPIKGAIEVVDGKMCTSESLRDLWESNKTHEWKAQVLRI